MADKPVSLEINEYALRNISNMEQRVYVIGDTHGFDSKQYRDASESLIRSLAQVMRLGGRITAEDDLSLIGDSWITYGVIFHRDRTPITNDLGDEVPPVAGTWSVHS